MIIPRQSQTRRESGTESHGSLRDSRVTWVPNQRPGYLENQGGAVFSMLDAVEAKKTALMGGYVWV